MRSALEQRRRLASPDREEVTAAARRFFDAGLCCAVETEALEGWEPHLIVFRSATAGEIVDSVEATVACFPGARVRLAGYDPLRPAPALVPAPVFCSPR